MQEKKAWMREIIINFTSKKIKKSISFGTDEVNLAMSISGHKFMSSLKDDCTIRITNLTYSKIIELIAGEYYDVEIFAGYRHGNMPKIFKGSVLYISDELQTDRSHVAIIICTSTMVAQFSQKRINLSLNSGINMYTALKFICDRAQITNANINTSLKQKILTEVSQINSGVPNFINTLTDQNDTFVVNTDETEGNSFSIYDYTYNQRIFTVTQDMIDFTGGPPRLTSSGLNLSLMPTINLKCGDVIRIDNALLNISANTKEEALKYYGNYLDKDGKYMIYEIDYDLENRGSSFSLNLSCKSLSIFSNLIGGNNAN